MHATKISWKGGDLYQQTLSRTLSDNRNVKENKRSTLDGTFQSIRPVLLEAKRKSYFVCMRLVYDSEETLVQAEVSRTKMLERMKDPLCKVSSKPINYAKLNSLYDTFVPQKQLSSEQVYWLPANEVASYNCNQSKPVTNFVRTRPAKSQVNTQLKMLKACFPEFDKVVKDRTTPSYITNGEWHFEHTKKCFVEEIIPFYEKLKTHVKGIEDNLFKEVSEYMKIFDELDKEYDQCVIDKKSLEIENKNLLIQNECLLAESLSKDICSVVLTSNIVVPMSVEPRSNCVKEHSKNLELKAEILKLKDQLQGKDELIRKLKAQIGNMNEVSADPNLGTLEFQALETKNTKLKEELTAVRIKNDSLRDENVSMKKCYQDSYKSKAESNSNVSSGATVLEKPKVLAPGLYAMTPKNLPARSENMKRVDNPLRSLNKRNCVDSSLRVKRTGFISKSASVCNICNECLVFGNHNKCGVKTLNSVNAKNHKVNNDAIVKQVWKATSKIFASVGSKWRPTGRKFTLGDKCPLTRITKPEVVPLEKSGSVGTSELANNVIVTPRFSKKPLTSYKRKDRKLKDISTGSSPNAETKAVNDSVVHIVLWYLDSGCSRHMTSDRSKLINYVEKFIGTVRFGNDQFAAIVSYGDYKVQYSYCNHQSLQNRRYEESKKKEHKSFQDYNKFEHVGPKFSKWKIKVKNTSESSYQVMMKQALKIKVKVKIATASTEYQGKITRTTS
ncbi:hypothetical protein Tco_0974597 [Tanacetum coccineum]|uniref:Retrovirus-related Pol polyprotein from transposon TNT 1-94-like beta-barrel domain-containing protein n=1 Tax=Tanacetum coccineum TaxID=301880 RepID=A0ABQ5EC12_9ASTR